ncbi:MAG TPA: thiamine phosphate synthase [Candidatus Sulfobium mesophilum]|nr:thiamine phosphate synthase [Candidatus Sulfobium mesophilum]
MYFNGLCFIADKSSCSGPLYETVFTALRAGVMFVQYRQKDGTRRQIYEEAARLRKLTRYFNATLIINDYADIALSVDADGVHLGQDDLPLTEARKIMGEKIIGISTHDLKQAKDASTGKADYIGFGPVFETRTKEAGKPRGLDNLRLIKQNVGVPVIAIGGINIDNIGSVFQAGADAAAIASAICRGDVSANAAQLVSVLKSMQ